MQFKNKYLLFFILLLVAMMSVTVAADVDNSTQTSKVTSQNNEHQIATLEKENNYQTLKDNISDNKNIIKTDKTSTKTENNIFDVNEENFEEYFEVSKTVTLNEEKISTGNITYNLYYFPENINLIVNSSNDNFKNTNLTFVAKDGLKLQNNGIELKHSFNSVLFEDLDLSFDDNYAEEYAIITHETSNPTTFNNLILTADIHDVDTCTSILQLEAPTIIKNSNILAMVPENPINWDSDLPVPKVIPIFVSGENVTLFNNNINIISNGNTSTSFYSIYGVYTKGENFTFKKNILTIDEATGYAYALVNRAKENIIEDNTIEVTSIAYSAGLNFEGSNTKNNIVKNNKINIIAGMGYTPWGEYNLAVAYGILISDFSYRGGNYKTTESSPQNNTFINNTVTGYARQFYGFEFYGGANTIVQNNTVLSDESYVATGIAAIGENITITNNTIEVKGQYNATDESVDYLRPITVGIYSYLSSEGLTIKDNNITTKTGRTIKMDSSNVIIENNQITTYNYTYSIETAGNNNTIQYNKIYNEQDTQNSIKSTGENTIQNNTDFENNIIGETGNNTNTNQTDTNQTTNQTDTNQTINTTTGPKTIILTPENFNNYITNGVLNNNINNGDTIDVRGTFEGQEYAFNITKAVNIISTTDDACFKFNSQRSETQMPDYSFIITTEGSGTNITGITFNNTQVLALNTSHITFDNIKAYCTQGFGWGIGSFSMRNSEYITIKNSYFNTTRNTGVSTVVFAASKNSIIENCTVLGDGMVGNLVYATTYNVEVYDQYGNSNITVKNNTIIGINIPGETCYSICLQGTNFTIENNYVENTQGNGLKSQYKEEGYTVEGDTGLVIVRNNKFAGANIDLNFDRSILTNNTADSITVYTNSLIENNTFNNLMTIRGSNNTINNNQIISDEEYAIIIKENTENIIITNNQLASTSYAGENAINGTCTLSENNTSINDKLKENLILTLEPINDTKINEKIIITGTLTDKNGNKLKNMNITIIINGNIFNDMTNNKGVYTFRQTANISGINNITVSYDRESKYNIITVNTTFTVNKEKTTLYLYSIDNSTNNVKITGKLLSEGKAINGAKLTLTVNDKNYTITPGSSGYFSYTTEPTNGKNTVTVTYAGNEIYNPATTTTTFTSNSKPKATLYLYEIDNTTSNVKITGKLLGNGKAINGAKLTLNVNGKEYSVTPGSSGYFSYTVTAENGANTVLVTYNGNNVYAKTTATTSFTSYAKKKATLYLYSIDNSTSTVKISGKLLGDGKAISGAKLVLNVNGKEYSVTPGSSGYFSYTVNADYGLNTVLVSFEGNNDYAPITAQSTFTSYAKKKTTLYLYSIDNSTSSVKITGKLLGDGKAISGSKLSLIVNGKEYTVTPGSSGYFSYTVNADNGVNSVSVSFAGNDDYAQTSAETSFTSYAKKKATLYLYSIDNSTSSVKISGKLLGDGKAISGAKLVLNVNGKEYSVTPGSSGYFSYTVNADNGVNSVSVSFAGNDDYAQSSVNTSFTSYAKKKAVLYAYNPSEISAGQTTTISGKLLTADKKALSGKTLTININSKQYTVTTNKDGYYSYKYQASTSGLFDVVINFAGDDEYLTSSYNTTLTVK